ncbi:MAG: methyl-accepting chemotaxis protein [Lachnospiraceae bacterium]|nr:methyl-accepting chemotaxis protein [Lachnospiraceae bacterium]
MKDLSLRIKLLLCTVPSFIALIISVIVFAVMINSTYKQSESVYFDTLYEINSNLVNADRDFYQAMQASTSQFHMKKEQNMQPGASSFDQAKNDRNREDYEKNAKQVTERVEKAQSIAMKIDSLYTGTLDENGKNYKQNCDNFLKEFNSWYAGFDSKAPDGDEKKFQNYSDLFEAAREDLDNLQIITENWAKQRNSDLAKSINSSIIALVAIFTVLIAVLLVTTILVIKKIINGVGSVTTSMQRLAENDLTIEIKEDNSKDEIGKMNHSFIIFKNNLYSAVTTMHTAADELADAFVNMQEKTNNSQMSMREITKAATELANTATTQAEDVSDIVTSMTELNNIMNRSVTTADSLTDASTEIDNATKQGRETVDELGNINKASLEAFNKIFDAIESIKTQADKISEASGLISGIANQTNLLSLNASIEAARAGEHGRGFAVVAEEIRKLSDESKSNVEVITNILQELSEATNIATALSDEVKEYVSKQNDSVVNTGNAFGDIISKVDSVNEAIGEIESINKVLEQKVTAISSSVESLSAISEENAATAQELSATSEVVKKSVNELVDTQEHVGAASENLNNIVKSFKTE